MQTKASMVVPCYNKAKYIDGMFQSIYDQEYDNIELILVNDGSTDDTLKKIRSWAPRFEQRGFTVVVIDQENMGVGAAVLNGLKRVTGEYIYMPDSDDRLEPQYVSHTAEVLDKKPSVDWVICNANWSLRSLKLAGPDVLSLLLLNTYSVWSVWSKVVRKSYMEKCRLVENYVPARFTQEPSVNIPLAIGGSVPFLLFENLYVYIRREHSIMESANMDFASLTDFYDGYLKLELEILKRYGMDSEKNISLAKLGVQFHLLGQMELMVNKSITSSRGLFSTNVAGALAEYASLDLSLYSLIAMLFTIHPDFEAERNAEYDRTVDVKCDPEFDAGFIALLNGSKKASGRLILCAALSKTSQKILSLLQRQGIQVDECWDSKAANAFCCGIPLAKPDYASLCDDDMLIISTVNVNIYHEIRSHVKKGCTANAHYVMRKLIAKQIENEKKGML